MRDGFLFHYTLNCYALAMLRRTYPQLSEDYCLITVFCLDFIRKQTAPAGASRKLQEAPPEPCHPFYLYLQTECSSGTM
jgi:hypothetical protein